MSRSSYADRIDLFVAGVGRLMGNNDDDSLTEPRMGDISIIELAPS